MKSLKWNLKTKGKVLKIIQFVVDVSEGGNSFRLKGNSFSDNPRWNVVISLFKKKDFPVHKLVTILPNFPIILNGLWLPGSGTFTFPPATRFNKSKEKQIERLKPQKAHQLKNPLLLSFYGLFIWKFWNNCFSRWPLISLIKV